MKKNLCCTKHFFVSSPMGSGITYFHSSSGNLWGQWGIHSLWHRWAGDGCITWEILCFPLLFMLCFWVSLVHGSEIPNASQTFLLHFEQNWPRNSREVVGKWYLVKQFFERCLNLFLCLPCNCLQRQRLEQSISFSSLLLDMHVMWHDSRRREPQCWSC